MVLGRLGLLERESQAKKTHDRLAEYGQVMDR